MKNGRSRLITWLGRPALIGLVLLLLTGGAQAQEVLPRLAEVGPWPVVSRLIGYDGRLWFANSVKGRNHNSADVYSFDALSGELRYERHLFSQDAGRPLVAGGLLYWPFEDGRVSLGWGDFMVTNGADWRLGVIDTAEIFHVHDLAKVGGRLVAGTSAWRAGFQVSDDGGRTWHPIYDHPTPERQVSRITELIEVNGRALAYLTHRDRKRVLAPARLGALAGLGLRLGGGGRWHGRLAQRRRDRRAGGAGAKRLAAARPGGGGGEPLGGYRRR
jgi:hypothetical protein